MAQESAPSSLSWGGPPGGRQGGCEKGGQESRLGSEGDKHAQELKLGPCGWCGATGSLDLGRPLGQTVLRKDPEAALKDDG